MSFLSSTSKDILFTILTNLPLASILSLKQTNSVMAKRINNEFWHRYTIFKCGFDHIPIRHENWFKWYITCGRNIYRWSIGWPGVKQERSPYPILKHGRMISRSSSMVAVIMGDSLFVGGQKVRDKLGLADIKVAKNFLFVANNVKCARCHTNKVYFIDDNQDLYVSHHLRVGLLDTDTDLYLMDTPTKIKANITKFIDGRSVYTVSNCCLYDVLYKVTNHFKYQIQDFFEDTVYDLLLTTHGDLYLLRSESETFLDSNVRCVSPICYNDGDHIVYWVDNTNILHYRDLKSAQSGVLMTNIKKSVGSFNFIAILTWSKDLYVMTRLADFRTPATPFLVESDVYDIESDLVELFITKYD